MLGFAEGPDAIYTGIGDSGNITDLRDSEREKIYRFDKEGGSKHLFSSGIRNTEKLRFRPGTQEIWGADHGSDWFGEPLGDKQGRQAITDDNPPDEFNRYVDGGFYGHPFIVGMRVPRIEYQNRPDIVEPAQKTIVPEWCFGAHFATNAFTFLTKNYFPGCKGTVRGVLRCFEWSVALPAGVAPAGVTVVATLHGKRASIALAKQSFSR